MKKSIKQLLSVVLVIAMMASLLIVPAAAVEPGAVGYTWDFGTSATDFHDPNYTGANDEEGTYGSKRTGYSDPTSDTYEVTYKTLTLTGRAGAYNKQWCMVANGAKLTVPVSEACRVTVTTQYDAAGTIGLASDDNKTTMNGAGAYTYDATAAGDVVITGTGTTYITTIELSELPADGVYTITADATATVKVGETVSVAVSADKGGQVYATTEDTSLITLGDIANGKLPITGKAVGTATVTLGVTDGQGSAEITVTVDAPADPDAKVEAGVHKWADTVSAKPTDAGISFAPEASWAFGNSHGPQTKAADDTMTLALAGPANVTIETCGFGAGANATVTVGDIAAVEGEPTLKANDGGKTFTFKNVPAGEAVFTISNNTYIHGVTVEYVVAEGIHKWADTVSEKPTDSGISFAPEASWAFGNSHGPQTKAADDTMTLVLADPANVTIETCGFGAGANATVTVGDIAAVEGEPTLKANDGGKTFTFKNVPAGEAVFTISNNTYIHGVTVEYVTEEVPEVLGNGKVDVWDFGAATLDETRFNNMITVDVLKNSAWGDKTAGSFGNAELNGLTWFAGGSTNHRIYTTNADMAGDPMVTGAEGMSDVKAEDPYFKDVEGYDATKAYAGYVYSNNNAQGKTIAEGRVVYIGLELKAGDKVSIVVSSNGGNSTITFEGPSGVEATSLYETCNRKQGEVKTFYAREDGAYKIYSADEKLVVARVYREHPTQLVLTGDVTVPEGKTLPAGLSLTFTNNKSGSVKEAEVKEGETAGTYTYRAVLAAPYDYTVAVKNSKGGFIVETGGALELAVPAEGDVAEPHDVGLAQVPLVTIQGTLTGPDAAYVAAHKPVITMTPGPEYIYAPEVTVDGLNYSFEAQQGVEYAVEVTMVNDFSGPETATVKYDAAKADDTIVLTAKPTYDITLTTSPADVDLSNAKITFVNLFEAGKGDETQTLVPYDATEAGKGAYPYTYTFTGATGIKLRDGQYEVLVAGVGAPEQGTTANLKVNGAAATLEIPFNTEIPSVWDFADADFDETDLPVARGGDGNYKGLVLEGNIQKNKTYCLMGNAVVKDGVQTLDAAKVKIPVKAAGNVVTIEFCYSGTGTLGNVAFAAYPSADGGCGGSTSKFQTVSYTATEADATAGFVELNIADTKAETDANGPQIYLTKVTASTETYQPTLKVGADKDYKTVNAALAAVDKMARTPEQRVTIEIDPGTYEEHVIVTANNVTLKNAKAADAKLELKNKGVDIGDNEVRITHYYGTGYDYYSMTPGTFQWNEDTLKASVANGYPATENKGDGKYSGYGYWCASVLVKGSGFEAEGIIFENSFNQYVSKKSTEDTIVPNAKLKEDKTNPRAEMKTVGDTTVQNKAYVERAAAVAITDTADQAYFNHCAIVGRQDALYGDPIRAAFYDCDIYGGTDYIFGPMTAVFAQCDLILNTSDTDTDVAYIVAPQQGEGVRGYLMWNCTVTSTTPGVNTASTLRSKPGQWGRPWSTTSEAVFYATNVESTLTTVESGAKVATEGDLPLSLIGGAGWLSGLSSGSARCVEFDTIEAYTNIDNSAKRDTVMSGGVLTEAKTADGVDITDYKTWMGDWNPLPDNLTVVRQTQGTYVETDKAALKAAITAADAYKVADDVTVMPAGTTPETVTKDQKFITQDVVDALAKALADAKTVLKDVTATQAQVDAAVKALTDAAAAFNAAVQVGTSEPAVETDRTALTAAVTAAEGVYAVTGDATVMPTGTKANTVTRGQKFVTQDAVDALAKAIADAKAVLANANATQAQVDAAVAALNAAVQTFQNAIQTGTRGSFSGGGSSASSSSTATTTTKTNANGDTVRKTTDRSGNVVYTVTDKSGEVIAKVEIPAARASTKKFKDVPEGHWAEASINDLAALGMVNGVADEIYDMVSPVTRGSVATILFRLAQAKGVAADFSDVAADAWYADAVGWAAKVGVVTGFEDGTFKADETITREQLAVMLYRFANLLAVDTRATGDLNGFVDAEGVSGWAQEAMTWAVGAGIIKGNDAKELNATDAATRAETACMVDRFIALLK